MDARDKEFLENYELRMSLLDLKMNEFKDYYNKIKEINPETRFILIIGRIPPPFEPPLQSINKFQSTFLEEAIGTISIEEAHIFFMDKFTYEAGNFLSIEAQKEIRDLYQSTSIIEFPLFIGSIIDNFYSLFQDVFDAIIFDGGVCFNIALELSDIQKMIKYLHNSSSFLLIDTDSNECDKKKYKRIQSIPILENKFVEFPEYDTPAKIEELIELKKKPLKVGPSYYSIKLLFEGSHPVFRQKGEEFENAFTLEKHLLNSDLSKTHYFTIKFIKRGEKYLPVIDAYEKKIIAEDYLTVCLPSQTNISSAEKLEQLKIKLIFWLDLNGFEGQYQLIQGKRNIFYIKIYKQVGKAELGGGVNRRRIKKKKSNRKWSLKYKKSINCRKPKGFSQKQYCKYGRSKRKRI